MTYEVPETFLDAANCAEFGYPEAKWVCERLLLRASEMYGDASGNESLIQECSVRIGQMTGPERLRSLERVRTLPYHCPDFSAGGSTPIA